MRGHLLLHLHHGPLLEIISIMYVLELYGWHNLLYFQDEYALGYISVRVSDSSYIYRHSESQECAKWDEDRFPPSSTETLICTTTLEGRYVSIQKTGTGSRPRSMILCEVVIMGVISGTLLWMFPPKTSSSYNLFPRAVIEE